VSLSPAGLGRALLRFFLHAFGFGVPSMGALAAAAGFAFWVMGIPGTSNPDYYQNWLFGLIVLGCYLGAYGVYLIAALASAVTRRPWLFYGATAIIWLCLFVASSIMQHIWTQIFVEP
jgi:hypothetical protein